MKKFLSVLLAVIMAITVCVPAFAADSEEVYPTIYIEGQGAGLYDNAGNSIYPLDVDWMSYLTEGDNMKTLLKDIALGDYDGYADDLYDLLAPVYEKVTLDDNGQASDGSGLRWWGYDNSVYTVKNSTGNCFEMVTIPDTLDTTDGTSFPIYRLHYDWRLSPVQLADDAYGAIQAVMAKTGAKKVNVISRCLGTNIAAILTAKHGNEGIFSQFIFDSSSINGIGLCDAMFTGKITLDARSVDNFVTYYTSVEGNEALLGDDSTTSLVVALVTLLDNVNTLSIGTDMLQYIVDAAQKTALPKFLKVAYGSFPSYWAMTGKDSVKAGEKFIFSTAEEQEKYAGLIEKIDEYYSYQKDFDTTLSTQQESGLVNFNVISKYDFPLFPLSSDSNKESDMFVTTDRTSFGATVADSNSTLSATYLASADSTYVSADKKIDASTCMFRDRTWFIKDLEHRQFPDCVNDLESLIIRTNGATTVFTDENYTQFLQFSGSGSSDSATGTLTPIKTAADTEDSTSNYITGNPLKALFNFLKNFVYYIINWFKNLNA